MHSFRIRYHDIKVITKADYKNIATYNERHYITRLELLREAGRFRMKTIIASDQVCLIILMILTIHSAFLVKKCNGQFHWGKNYKLEAQKLREMFARYKAHTNSTTTPMARKNTEVIHNTLL